MYDLTLFVHVVAAVGTVGVLVYSFFVLNPLKALLLTKYLAFITLLSGVLLVICGENLQSMCTKSILILGCISLVYYGRSKANGYCPYLDTYFKKN